MTSGKDTHNVEEDKSTDTTSHTSTTLAHAHPPTLQNTDTSGADAAQKQLEQKLEKLSHQETDELVQSFKDHFDVCTKACKKPNILVAGITGAGKSSLVNAVFGEDLAVAGAGMPVTQHFQKFEPKDKPVVIYDSKGLEWSEHENFIKETGKFFTELRKKKDLADHIHVVWYVVNAARGRFENFEAELVREVFAPTPVIFVFNKCDLADGSQMNAITKVIKDENLPNNKGVHITIANRTNWTQSWCPQCLSDDVFFDEETKEFECSNCGHECLIKGNYGMQKLIKHTVKLLPELAKDAFMFSQTASLKEKDKRAKNVVKDTTKNIKLDSSGNFIKKVAQMCAKLFVIWGWPLTADTFKEGLASMQKEYVSQLQFKERLAAAAVDKIFGSRLSKAFSGLIGLTMNRGMKKLNQQLIEHATNDSLSEMKMEDFMQEADINENLVSMFFQSALMEGIDPALDKFWDLTNEELQELLTQVNFQQQGNLFGLNIDEEKQREIEKLLEESEKNPDEISISEVTVDDENAELETSTTTTTTANVEKETKVQEVEEEDDEEDFDDMTKLLNN